MFESNFLQNLRGALCNKKHRSSAVIDDENINSEICNMNSQNQYTHITYKRFISEWHKFRYEDKGQLVLRGRG